MRNLKCQLIFLKIQTGQGRVGVGWSVTTGEAVKRYKDEFINNYSGLLKQGRQCSEKLRRRRNAERCPLSDSLREVFGVVGHRSDLARPGAARIN